MVCSSPFAALSLATCCSVSVVAGSDATLSSVVDELLQPASPNIMPNTATGKISLVDIRFALIAVDDMVFPIVMLQKKVRQMVRQYSH